MNLITFFYRNDINYLVFQCSKCKGLQVKSLRLPIKTQCSCDHVKYEFTEKLPLHYIIHNKPEMKVYVVENKKTGKQYIGSIIGNDSIKSELDRLSRKDLRLCPALAKDIQELGIEHFSIKMLMETASILSLEMSESLYINGYNTMEPSGYNTEYTMKKVLTVKKSKR